jgi:hypothetical protein
MLGDGWYSQRSINIGPPSLLLTLRVHLMLANGSTSTMTVSSDLTWAQSTGPVVYSDIYNGGLAARVVWYGALTCFRRGV